MKYAVCFGDLVKGRGEWETAVRANDRGVAILTPPRPTMGGSANPGFRFVRYDDIEDHIRVAAVPGAIEALEHIKTKLDALGTDLDGIYDDASAALRVVARHDAGERPINVEELRLKLSVLEQEEPR